MYKKEFKYADLIGVPFKNLGRDVKTGLDCYGLVHEIFRRAGMEIGEYYSDCSDKAKINEILRREVAKSSWREVKPNAAGELPVPCLIALRFNSPPGVVNHTGVYIGHGQFLHTRERIGCCVDRIDSIMWKRQIVGFYEFVGK